MSLVRLLPAWLHAVADYAVGALVIVVALVAGDDAASIATGVVVGSVVLVVSMVTRYPLGVAKVLPFTVHSAGDYLAAGLLSSPRSRWDTRATRQGCRRSTWWPASPSSR